MAAKMPGLYKDSGRRFHPTAPDPILAGELRKILIRENPQIVVSSGWILYSFLPVKSFSQAKLFVRHHDYAYVCPKRTLLYRNGLLCSGPGLYKCFPCSGEQYGTLKGTVITASYKFFRQLHRSVDYHLPISQFVGEAVRLHGQPAPDSLFVVPAPVPDDIFEFTPAESLSSSIPVNEDYILYVGALTEHKGIEILLKAYQGLENRARLVLIGTEWPDSPTSYPEGIIVLKNAPHELVMEAFQRCLFAVVPSIWPEPFGQVAVEAMAAKKAVIASAHGGLLDIVIDEKTGLLVRPGDPETLRQAMVRLLDGENLRTQLGERGFERARARFTRSQVASQLEEIFNQVIG